MTDKTKLKDFFTSEELEWKPQQLGVAKSGKPYCMVLCYIQARAIQDRLDDVYGVENWKDSYRFETNGVICELSVYNKDTKDWIKKENGAPETQVESFKGGISSAFKRVAASGYGIGRYLYKLDTTFAICQLEKPNNMGGWNKAKSKDGKIIYWQTPQIKSEFLPKNNA